MTPEDRPCDACNAEPGEPCRPGCLGYALATGQLPRCSCATNADGSVTRFLCPRHADADPCLTMARVTGKRRTGTIRRGTCTACGWEAPSNHD